MTCGKCGLYWYECVCLGISLIDEKSIPDDKEKKGELET